MFRSTVIPLLLTGLVSILGQVVILRELHVAFYGSELIYLFAIGLWLFWSAIGAFLAKGPQSPPSRRLMFLLFWMGPLILFDIAFIRGSRIIFSGPPGAYLPFLEQLFVAAAALFPIAFPTGLLFSWAAKRFIAGDPQRKTLGTAYALESVGGLAGGLLATVLFHWEIQNLQVAMFCILLSASTPILTGALPPQTWRGRGYILAALGLCMLLAWMWPFAGLDMAMSRWNHPRILAVKDTPYGRITLTGLSGQVSLFDNGALSYETEGTEAEAFIHPAVLQHPAPARILVLGGGVEGLIRELLDHRPERIDYVELNPQMLATAIPHLPPRIQASLNDPRVRLIFGEPRRFLEGSGTYDMILVGMPEPTSGQGNRFFSREFFALCAEKLRPQGIMAFRLKSAENFWTPPLLLRTGSIYNALRTVFPEVVFLAGATNIVTASFSPLPLDPAVHDARLRKRAINSRLVTRPYLNYLYTNDRFFDLRDRLQKSAAPANTDVHPICYRFSAMIWLAQFFPSLNAVQSYSLFPSGYLTGRWPLLILFLMALGLFLSCRLSPAVRRMTLMAAVGFCGMVLENVLLLCYQIKSGVLYQDIGILLTSFMAGLALGPMFFHTQKPKAAWGFVLAIGFFLLSLLVYAGIAIFPVSGLPAVMAALGLTGLFVSAFFAFISRFDAPDPAAMASPLFAADLFGGCLGSLVSGFFLIPFFGLDMAVAVVIMINASLLILVV